MIHTIKMLIENTTFLTIISGVLVFVICQLFVELIINPYKKYRTLIEEIGYAIALNSCYYSNPCDLTKNTLVNMSIYEDASRSLRDIGSKLAGYIGIVPKWRFKKRKKLNNILDSLIGLSNGLFITSNYNPIPDSKKYEANIRRELNI